MICSKDIGRKDEAVGTINRNLQVMILPISEKYSNNEWDFVSRKNKKLCYKTAPTEILSGIIASGKVSCRLILFLGIMIVIILTII